VIGISRFASLFLWSTKTPGRHRPVFIQQRQETVRQLWQVNWSTANRYHCRRCSCRIGPTYFAILVVFYLRYQKKVLRRSDSQLRPAELPTASTSPGILPKSERIYLRSRPLILRIQHPFRLWAETTPIASSWSSFLTSTPNDDSWGTFITGIPIDYSWGTFITIYPSIVHEHRHHQWSSGALYYQSSSVINHRFKLLRRRGVRIYFEDTRSSLFYTLNSEREGERTEFLIHLYRPKIVIRKRLILLRKWPNPSRIMRVIKTTVLIYFYCWSLLSKSHHCLNTRFQNDLDIRFWIVIAGWIWRKQFLGNIIIDMAVYPSSRYFTYKLVYDTN